MGRGEMVHLWDSKQQCPYGSVEKSQKLSMIKFLLAAWPGPYKHALLQVLVVKSKNNA